MMVIPCGVTATVSAQDKENLFSECDKFIKQLKEAGIRCRGDFRDNYTPGWKFNHWELKVCRVYTIKLMYSNCDTKIIYDNF